VAATPQVSVVMPVHNARPFLDESVGSILQQTLRHLEFVILDDASTDGSLERLRHWAAGDARIQLHESRTRLGLSGSSNAVVARARAPIVARMDADDIAHPDRLRRQLAVLQSRPDVVVVGALCDGIDATGRTVRPRDRWRLVRRSPYLPFAHGSAMFRRDVFTQLGGYDERAAGGEDQNLFRRMTAQGRVVTLPDVLYQYRYHSSNATLFLGTRDVAGSHFHNGNAMEALYRVGAMRLWAGDPPMLLRPILDNPAFRWNLKTLSILVPAVWGHVSPPTLRAFLRLSIRVRDLVAGLRVKDGRPYEWRSG
jgi:glycosyltransferase involved in cell wall biosynthesis